MENFSINFSGMSGSKSIHVQDLYSDWCGQLGEHVVYWGIGILIAYILWKWIGQWLIKYAYNNLLTLPSLELMKYHDYVTEKIGDMNNPYQRLEVFLVIENIIIKFLIGWSVMVIYFSFPAIL